MNPHRLLYGVACTALLLATAWWAVTAFMPQGAIDIDQAQLQQRLDARFPQKNCAMGMACVTLSSPLVKLTDGAPRIGLSADVLVNAGPPRDARQAGVLRRAALRALPGRLLPGRRADRQLLPQRHVPPEFVQVVQVRGPAVLRRALEGHPVYTLKGDTARSGARQAGGARREAWWTGRCASRS